MPALWAKAILARVYAAFSEFRVLQLRHSKNAALVAVKLLNSAIYFLVAHIESTERGHGRIGSGLKFGVADGGERVPPLVVRFSAFLDLLSFQGRQVFSCVGAIRTTVNYGAGGRLQPRSCRAVR